jgi:tetratricopeptide (TPR) repeat protein
VFRVTACLAFAISFVLSGATAQDFSRAENLYQHTDYEGSLALLDKNSGDSAVNFLIGRDYFMMGEFKKAGDYIQKAATGNPTNSEYLDWLGRAYGRRAETSNPLSAPSYASKARQAFEQAVKLNEKNTDALSDLFDYYVNAPGFLGGGLDKAEQVAQKIAAVDPPQGYYVRAQLAQKRKDFDNAEQSLRKAVAIAPHEVGHMITLAKFLANQGRTRESDAIFAQAERVNPNAPQVWFARADTLIKGNRNLQEARELLQKYVKAQVTVDDPPKTEAARLLKQFDR